MYACTHTCTCHKHVCVFKFYPLYTYEFMINHDSAHSQNESCIFLFFFGGGGGGTLLLRVGTISRVPPQIKEYVHTVYTYTYTVVCTQ